MGLAICLISGHQAIAKPTGRKGLKVSFVDMLIVFINVVNLKFFLTLVDLNLCEGTILTLFES